MELQLQIIMRLPQNSWSANSTWRHLRSEFNPFTQAEHLCPTAPLDCIPGIQVTGPSATVRRTSRFRLALPNHITILQ